MNREVAKFLRFLVVLDGRTRPACRNILGKSPATISRYLATARALGVTYEWDRWTAKYRVTHYGPFDIQALRRVRWPARERA